jgi:Inosine-uridine nucleoside N-ribohydrolase
MGGAFDMLTPEYNIRRDRAAAQIVFHSGVPITAVGLDVTTRCKLQAADIDRLRAANNPASAFLVHLIELWQDGHPDRYPTLHDPLAVAVSFLPTLVETRLGAVEVETSSPLTNGMTIFTPADRLPKGQGASTQVARQVDVRRFIDLFLDRLSRTPRQ